MSLIFLHIPKAAGTTLNEILYRNFKLKEIYKIDGTFPENSIKELMEKKLDERSRYELIMGHTSYGIHYEFAGEYDYMTMLRDPVKRVISLYHYIMTTNQHPLNYVFNKKNITFDEFLEGEFTTEHTNDQVRRISGTSNRYPTKEDVEKSKELLLNKFIYFGITERFDESMILLNKKIKRIKKIKYVRENITNYPKKIKLTNLQVSKVKELNELDIELYEWAKVKFDKHIQELDIENLIKEYRYNNSEYQRRHNLFPVFYTFSRKFKRKLHIILTGG